MSFGQITLPSTDPTPNDLRKAFVETSLQIGKLYNTSPTLNGLYQFIATSTYSIPSASKYKNQVLTLLNTTSSVVTLNGKINDYSSWTLDSQYNWWAILSDGTVWYCIGGQSTGSSSNGSWVKWADGTMICRGSANTDVTTLANANIGTYGWSLYYGSASVAFPQTFSTVPTLTVSPATTGSSVITSARAANVTTSGYTVYGVHSASVSGAPTTFIAIGKWK